MMLIKSLSSIMIDNEDKNRSRLSDKSLEGVIYTRVTKAPNSIAAPFSLNYLSIELQCTLDHRLKW